MKSHIVLLSPGEHGNDNQSDTFQLEDLALSKRSQMKFDALKSKSVRLDINFKSPSHTGLQTTEMVIFPMSIGPSIT